MPFEERATAAQRIAVIGGGISGMGAAYFLAQSNSVVMFEAEARLGGHARTVIAGKRGDQPVDTGFIVFNHKNYPNLRSLFDHLGVPTAPSSMSFGVSARAGGLEYGLADINTIFTQRRNFVRPQFLRMIRDILRFNKRADETITPDMTIGELIAELKLGSWFRDYYLTPFSGAIWSTPKTKILDFPAHSMIEFFKNHGLLEYLEDPQWYTVRGGSVEYVKRLGSAMHDRGVDIRLGAEIKGVRRTPFGVEVRASNGEWEHFDGVVFATHSDVTLKLLSDATGVERTALSAVRYQPNRAVLHSDPSVMPRNRKVWSSWCYVETDKSPDAPIDLSYWMNSLQPIPHDDPIFVTLNRNAPIREELIYDEKTFHHPVYDRAAIAAQETIRAINGQNNTWFCGAWMKNGFHEDGLASAIDVVMGIEAIQAMGVAAE
ncbi:MAG: FAD-dependent oxidoreductase [Boseongicola sp.]|nr:FAD-dependent oxidoreductase [Boseongicola sp.]MDD9976829.1 FAD-dependent oxidoreductase [Boseongicola sp.]